MKKREWKAAAREWKAAELRAGQQAAAEINKLKAEIGKLNDEIEVYRKNWRPVPITHPWQPRNPQCALCDEPRDSPRHAEALEGPQP